MGEKMGEKMTSERPLFEEWLQTTSGWKACKARNKPMHLRQNADGSYNDFRVNDRWLAWKARAHLSTPAQMVDVEYEIWQENMCVAGACGEREDARREILRYLLQYAQDSDCKIFEVTRVDVTDKLSQAIGDKT